jgi:hypothetical protein
MVAREGSIISGVRQVAGDLVEGDKVMGDKIVYQITAPAVVSQTPRPLAEFVGRESEIERLLDVLEPGGRVAITGVAGMGGIGKTELAKVIAGQVAGRFRDGVLWADCGQQDLTTIADLWAAAYSVQLPEGDLTTKATAWRGLVSGRESLLIFDDVRSGQDAKALFPPLGRSVVLITTRHTDHPAVRDAT